MKKKRMIIIYIILILIAISCLFFGMHLCKEKLNSKKIVYHKEARTNYITYLKDNKFYNSNYLEDDYNFVASLIDYFKVDYNYSYVLSEKINYVLTYDITALLEVYDSDNNAKPIEKSEFELIPKTTLSGDGEVIKLDLFNQVIDYQTYNQIVQNWKKEVSPEAVLNVSFNVSWTGYSKTFANTIGDNYTNTLKIPISQKTITISKPSNVSVDDKLTEKDKLPVSFLVLIGSTIFMIIACSIRLFMIISEINDEKDKYEQKINKILREFDRAITEAKGSFKKNPKDNNIEVNDFYELMDVHDNLNVPIIFYRDTNKKCTFVVRNDKSVYYCVFKKEEENKKEETKKIQKIDK